MRGRTLIVLALVVAALGAFVLFVERDLPDTEERKERADRLLGLEADEVRRVEIVADGSRVVLEREAPADEPDDASAPGDPVSIEAGWRLVEPIAARADGAEVDSLVRRLTGLDAERTVEEVEDPASNGLEPPRIEIVLGTEAGESRLRVGDPLPASTQRIVSLGASGPLRIVAGGVFEDAVREPGAWRDRDLFPWSRSAIERVRITGGESGDSVLLARRGEGFWIEAPFVDAADPDRADRLLLALTGLEADTFLDGPEAPTTGSGPELEVFVEDRAEPVRIALGDGPVDAAAEPEAESVEAPETAEVDRDPSRTEVLRVGEQWVRATTELREILGDGPDAWRSPRLTGWPVYEIDTLEVRDGDGETMLSRDGVDWRRGEEKILYSTVSELLTALVGFRAETVAEGTADEIPGGAEDLEIALTHKEGARERLRVWRTDESVLVEPDGREVVLRAPASSWDPVATALDGVREAEPLPPEPGPTGTDGTESDG